MDCARIANALHEGLHLTHPPIAMTFLDEPPMGIPHYAQSAPSACAFWKAAQNSLFYATAEDHYNCPIGAVTQGFSPPQFVIEQGRALIERMGQIQYFEAVEFRNVPRVEKPHRVIVYGPLKSFQNLRPEVALFICTPFQAMLLSEATGAVVWRGAGKEARTYGRPACAVIPSAIQNSAASVSLGCMGARTFAGIQSHELLIAIPSGALAESEQKLSVILKANAEMKNFYKARESQFPSASQSVEKSWQSGISRS
jgi:uncharacterized protein (DUF169 family)